MIELRSVSQGFGERVVLSEVNFSMAAGEIVFIVGKSGTGKSVLLRTLVGLLPPLSGEIWMDGTRVDYQNEDQLRTIRRRCGLVFQYPALLDGLSIFENVALGMRIQNLSKSESELEDKVKAFLRQVHVPIKYLPMVPRQLSLGIQKRVAIARTLAISPQYLLFDEPTTGQDPISTKAINVLIQQLAKDLKVGCLVVSHDMSSAVGIADRIFVLDNAKFVAEQSPVDLRKNSHPVVQAFLKEVFT